MLPSLGSEYLEEYLAVKLVPGGRWLITAGTCLMPRPNYGSAFVLAIWDIGQSAKTDLKLISMVPPEKGLRPRELEIWEDRTAGSYLISVLLNDDMSVRCLFCIRLS